MTFFFWYYSKGVRALGRASINILRAAIYRSGFFGLLRTLFSPWRRDVSLVDQPGFHPLLALQVLLNNVLSRFLGSLVRLTVILISLIVFPVIFIILLTFLLLYVLAPFGILVSIPLYSFSPIWGMSLFMVSGLSFFLGFLFWWNRTPDKENAKEWGRNPWIERAFWRMGIHPRELKGRWPQTREEALSLVTAFSLDPAEAQKILTLEEALYEKQEKEEAVFSWENLRRTSPLGKFWTYGYTPHLDQYSVDLSQADYSEYRKLHFVGRKEAVDLTVLTLTRPTQKSVLLTGNPGIGKKALIHTLARKIRENGFPSQDLNNLRILLLDLGSLMAESRGQALDPKGMVRNLFAEAVLAGNVVLVVENIEHYLLADSPEDVSDVFDEFLRLPSFRIIGTLTQESFHRLRERELPALKYFEVISLAEPTRDETIVILLDFFARLERKRPIFSYSGLEALLDASQRQNWDVAVPERTLDVAQEVLLFWEKDGQNFVIDKKTVDDFLSLKSGVPMGEVREEEKEKLLHLEELLHRRIVGQEEAVRQLAEAFRKARAGLGNEKKPVGSFLFLGPTGVGKTETAKALASVYFGDEERLVRLDMSEFQAQESIAELIGSQGAGLSGRMTDLVREHPYSILLLDEIEKAHPRVLDLFLQILDEGFVTDGFGKKVNFRNLIIIATSNAGANLLRKKAEDSESIQNIKDELIDAIIQENIFRPEFLNRFDGVVLFNTLVTDEIERVTQMKLDEFIQRLETEKKIHLHYGPEMVKEIVARGYEPEFGVRSINRYLADVIEDRIVKKIIEGSVKPGASITLEPSDLV